MAVNISPATHHERAQVREALAHPLFPAGLKLQAGMLVSGEALSDGVKDRLVQAAENLPRTRDHRTWSQRERETREPGFSVGGCVGGSRHPQGKGKVRLADSRPNGGWRLNNGSAYKVTVRKADPAVVKGPGRLAIYG